MNPKEQEWLKDFQEFASTESIPVPNDVSQKVLQHVHKQLNPSKYLIFMKILGVHLVTGTLSMAICNQFDMNPFKLDFSLSDYFMKFGHSTCMVFCGVLFVGLSFLVSSYLIRTEELRVLKKSAFIQSFSLGIVSLSVFWFFGAEIALGIATFWLLGALIGGISVSELVFRLRLRKSYL